MSSIKNTARLRRAKSTRAHIRELGVPRLSVLTNVCLGLLGQSPAWRGMLAAFSWRARPDHWCALAWMLAWPLTYLGVALWPQVGYVVGYTRNAVTSRKIDALLEQARIQCCKTGQKARLFDDVYYAAGTWSEPRRLVMKAEWLLKGANPRFLLTNLDLPPKELYDQFYVQRGADSEHRIKELKLGIHADRLSCHSFLANQFRLMLAQAAYILLLRIRQAATGTDFATAQVERLRAMLIKGAAKVTLSTRRVLVELSNYNPFAAEIRHIIQRLTGTQSTLFS